MNNITTQDIANASGGSVRKVNQTVRRYLRASEASVLAMDTMGMNAPMPANFEEVHRTANMKESNCPGMMCGFYHQHCLAEGTCRCDGQDRSRKRKTVDQVLAEVRGSAGHQVIDDYTQPAPEHDKQDARDMKRVNEQAKPKGKRHFRAPGSVCSPCGSTSDHRTSDYLVFGRDSSKDCKRCVALMANKTVAQ